MTIHAVDNLPPVAVVSTDKTSGPAPLTVCFDGSQSYDPEGAPLTYDWELGDGTITSTAAVCHTYKRSGRYNVTFAVVDIRNAVDIEMLTIDVSEGVPVPALPGVSRWILAILLAIAGGIVSRAGRQS